MGQCQPRYVRLVSSAVQTHCTVQPTDVGYSSKLLVNSMCDIACNMLLTADAWVLVHSSAEAKDIVAQLLTVDSDARLSAEQALQHPWVAGKCFEDDENKGETLIPVAAACLGLDCAAIGRY